MINNPKVVIQELPSEAYPKTSPDFGNFYEDSLKKKSLRYIDGLKSIYDPGIFMKNGRKIIAVEAYIIKGKDKKGIEANFTAAINNNDFVVFPYLEHNYQFSVDSNKYELKFVKNDIIVGKYDSRTNEIKDVKYFYEKGITKFFKYRNETFYFDNFIINGNNCWQIYLLDTDIFMITYNIELEIDGLFIAEKDFKLEDYKAEEFHVFNKKDFKTITKNTHIIYEIKSGKNLYSLSNQIMRDYYFFEKFFRVFSRYNIKNFMIFGFFRTDKKLEEFKESQDFKKLENIPIPVILFRYDKFLFGENILYESVELSEINELKYLVGELNKKVDSMHNILIEIKRNMNINPSGNNTIDNQPQIIPPQPQPQNYGNYTNLNIPYFPYPAFYFAPMPIQNGQNYASSSKGLK